MRASSDSAGLALLLRGGSAASRANADTVTGCACSLVAGSAESTAGGVLRGAAGVEGGDLLGTPAGQKEPVSVMTL